MLDALQLSALRSTNSACFCRNEEITEPHSPNEGKIFLSTSRRDCICKIIGPIECTRQSFFFNIRSIRFSEF